jgi:hypothetical protein
MIRRSKFERDLYIEIEYLEDEWRRHSKVCRDWDRRANSAEYAYNMAKANLQSIEAQIFCKVKENPFDYGWTESKGPTEAFITSCTKLSPEYRAAYKKLNKVQKIWKDLVSMSNVVQFQRKESLKGLTQLWVFQYPTSGRIPKEVRDSLEDKSKQMMEEAFQMSMKDYRKE